MTVDDDMDEVSTSSLMSSGNEDGLSAEDIAWADSCLIKDPETFGSDLNSLRDVLLEIISSQSQSLDFASSENDGVPEGTDVKILPSAEKVKTSESLAETDNDLVMSSDEETETNMPKNVNFPNSKIKKFLSQLLKNETSQTSSKDPFLPTCKEDLAVSEVADSGFALGFLTNEKESLADDIFKVWDLNVPAEEDELGIQLKKALEETPFSSITLSTGNSGALGAWDYLKDRSLDSLTAGMADMSLNQNST